MTEDYKNKLLKYLTGKIAEEMGNNTPYFRNETTNTNDIIATLNTKYPGGWSIKNTILAKDSSGEFNGKAYVLCLQTDSTNNFILLIEAQENKIKLLQIIENYSSGTKFGTIYCMNVDEQGQCFIAELVDGQKRIVLLNNISIKLEDATEYEVILKKSYYLQGNIANATNVEKIIKSPENAYYLLYGTTSSNAVITQLKINVGSENEWIDYTNNVITAQHEFNDIYAIWDSSGNISINIWTTLTDTIYLFANNDTTIYLKKTFADYDIFFKDELYSYFYAKIYAYSLNMANIVSFAVVGRDDLYYPAIGYANIKNNIATLKFEKIYDNVGLLYEESVLRSSFKTQMIDDVVCCALLINESDSQTITYLQGYANFLILNEDKCVEKKSQNLIAAPENIIFITQKVFNLYTYGLNYKDYNTAEEKNITTKIIYNPLNYNGITFENSEMLVPTTGNLYDDNNNLIFARNLYNKTISSNIINSTIQVPNTMLNDITIVNKELLSKNNVLLIADSEQINKNIYETLNINFINKITIENQNDPSNIVQNNVGAIRLANSIANLADYDDAKGLNINIVYDNDTTYSYDLNPKQIVINGNTASIELSVYVPSSKNISKIEIRSIDTDTIYQTITDLNLQKEKYYKVTQNVEIQ